MFGLVRSLRILRRSQKPLGPEDQEKCHQYEPDRIAVGGEIALRVGIGARALSRSEWLSGGEAQRTAIARALINDPAVIIADEPTAHLDTKLSRDFLGIMERLNAEGKTILIASHDPLVYESAQVDRVVEMRDGRIRESGRAA